MTKIFDGKKSRQKNNFNDETIFKYFIQLNLFTEAFVLHLFNNKLKVYQSFSEKLIRKLSKAQHSQSTSLDIITGSSSCFHPPLTKHPTPEETNRKLSVDEERRIFPSNYAFAKRSTSSQSFVRYFHLKDIVNKWQAEWKKQQQHKKLFSTELSCTQE